MSAAPKQIALLGATGSIGQSTCDVVAAFPDRLRLTAITANQNVHRAVEIARCFSVPRLVICDPAAAGQVRREELPADCELLIGPEAVAQVATDPEVDLVVSAIVGRAGLEGTLAAVEAGKTVALANKESLVVAGSLVSRLARERGATLLPVDSEHSALFQALQAGKPREVRRLILTASGGPFRGRRPAELMDVTVEQALNHPTWSMGPKVTIDSATLMNKALELIEAHWLFGVGAEHLEAVIHPESIVHSMVEFRDGSVLAQLSPPDMRLPIQYALLFPDRSEGPAAEMDWSQPQALRFEPADPAMYPALELGKQVAGSGGGSGAVLNAANEAAVAAFLAGEMAFHQIVPACRGALENHHHESEPTLERLLELDRWARREVQRWVSTGSR